MNRNYCSLADIKYLPQLLALYQSLKRHSSEPIILYFLALDYHSERVLRDLALPELSILSIQTFTVEMDLEAIRENRTYREWCWTLASQLCEWLLLIGMNEVVYLDADTYVFSNPVPVFEEIGNRAVAITPHRLIPSKSYLERNGEFNVGFLVFKNTDVGRKCSSWWAAQVRQRCSENYGCGDQFYLNSFIPRYGDEVCVIQNIGVNTGPWSVANWNVTEGPRLDGQRLILYHFHEYLHDVRLTNYELRPEDVELIYKPYIAAVEAAKVKIESLGLQAI